VRAPLVNREIDNTVVPLYRERLDPGYSPRACATPTTPGTRIKYTCSNQPSTSYHWRNKRRAVVGLQSNPRGTPAKLIGEKPCTKWNDSAIRWGSSTLVDAWSLRGWTCFSGIQSNMHVQQQQLWGANAWWGSFFIETVAFLYASTMQRRTRSALSHIFLYKIRQIIVTMSLPQSHIAVHPSKAVADSSSRRSTVCSNQYGPERWWHR
jgi:hypothetical protein